MATKIPAKYNINFIQGATFDLPINYQVDGASANLSGYSARLKVRRGPKEPVLVEFNSNLTANGFILMTGSPSNYEDGANGNIRIFMTAANADFVPNKEMRYDLEIESSSGIVDRVMEGKFDVWPQYTKS